MGIVPEHFPYVLRALGLKPTVPPDPGAITVHAITRLKQDPLTRNVGLNGGAIQPLTTVADHVLTGSVDFTGDLIGPGGAAVDLALTWSATNGGTPVPIDEGIDDVLLLVNYDVQPVNPS